MPEHHHGPGTDDLDTAFRGLVDDVETHSRRPGAARAVRRAGSRRAAVAAALVVAVLVVAVLGGRALQDDRLDGTQVVGVPSMPAAPSTALASAEPAGDVPPPAVLTLADLNDASAGWVTWEKGTVDTTDVASCLSKSALGPDPAGSSIDHYRVRARADAFFQRTRYASVADSNRAMLATVQEFDACPEGTGLHHLDLSADLEVVAFDWGTGERRGTVWLVNHDDRMDVFHVVGVPKASDDVIARVARLVAADVQVP